MIPLMMEHEFRAKGWLVSTTISTPSSQPLAACQALLCPVSSAGPDSGYTHVLFVLS
eukprot:COSAG05_NODE_1175_length_5616_cov_2.565343_4_plen_57_part_00